MDSTEKAQKNVKKAWIKNKHLTNPTKKGKKLGKRQGQTNKQNQTLQPQAKEKEIAKRGRIANKTGSPAINSPPAR